MDSDNNGRADGGACVSSVVFGFVIVLVMLFSLGGGGGLVFWVGTRKERRLTAQAEKMQIEKDALRDKEIQVHATATQHYLGEVDHWRKEFQRIQQESETFKRLLDDQGIAYNRMSMATTAVDSQRPASYYEKNKRDTMPSLPGKLNFDEKSG